MTKTINQCSQQFSANRTKCQHTHLTQQPFWNTSTQYSHQITNQRYNLNKAIYSRKRKRFRWGYYLYRSSEVRRRAWRRCLYHHEPRYYLCFLSFRCCHRLFSGWLWLTDHSLVLSLTDCFSLSPAIDLLDLSLFFSGYLLCLTPTFFFLSFFPLFPTNSRRSIYGPKIRASNNG